MPRHVIVDGSNIATEGRKMPSLKQLSDAVTAYMAEFPDDVITVVVDATFGHRIDPSEVDEFDAAVAHNELVAPPAGAIGRGDAFVLSIANKTKGSILSNDSYQEFHGEYPWVFDEGRLIGGKPVPNVGWVFVLRNPVHGPVSRKSVKAGRSVDKNTGRVPRASKEASLPMPVPKAPPPGAAPKRKEAEATRTPAPAPAVAAKPAPPKEAPPREAPLNELMAFIDFVEHHPVGSSVNAVVESYSSHGAYVTVGNVRGYVPLRLMSDPPARSAHELGKVGDAVTLVVHSFTPARRSIDMAVPAAAIKAGVTPRAEPAAVEAAVIAEVAPGVVASEPAEKRTRRRKSAAPAVAASAPEPVSAAEPVAAEPAATPARKPRARKSAAAAEAPADTAAIEPTPGPVPETAAKPKRRVSKKAAPPADAPLPVEAPSPAPPKQAPAKRAAKKAAAPVVQVAAPTPPKPAKAAARKKQAAEPAPAPIQPAPAPAPAKPAKAAAKQAGPVKKAPAKRAPAKKAAPGPDA